jgi:hypothetical protein
MAVCHTHTDLTWDEIAGIHDTPSDYPRTREPPSAATAAPTPTSSTATNSSSTKPTNFSQKQASPMLASSAA